MREKCPKHTDTDLELAVENNYVFVCCSCGYKHARADGSSGKEVEVFCPGCSLGGYNDRKKATLQVKHQMIWYCAKCQAEAAG